MYACIHAISFVQLLSTDYVKIRRTIYTAHTYLYTGGFVTCLFLMYTNTSAFLQQAGDPPSSYFYRLTLTLYRPFYRPFTSITTTSINRFIFALSLIQFGYFPVPNFFFFPAPFLLLSLPHFATFLAPFCYFPCPI